LSEIRTLNNTTTEAKKEIDFCKVHHKMKEEGLNAEMEIKLLKKTIEMLNIKMAENKSKLMDETVQYYKNEINMLNKDLNKLKRIVTKCKSQHDIG
jgi:cob(I)alamin adenosyltransferase